MGVFGLVPFVLVKAAPPPPPLPPDVPGAQAAGRGECQPGEAGLLRSTRSVLPEAGVVLPSQTLHLCPRLQSPRRGRASCQTRREVCDPCAGE